MDGISSNESYIYNLEIECYNWREKEIINKIIENNREGLKHLLFNSRTEILVVNLDNLIPILDKEKGLNGRYTPLYIALAYEAYDIVEDLVRYGASPNVRSIENENGQWGAKGWGFTAKEKFSQYYVL